MELMLLVYLVENLSYNGTFFKGVAFSLLIISVIFFIIKVVHIDGDTYELTLNKDSISLSKLPKKFVALIAILFTLHTLLPERQTMIYMVGAYAAQEVLTSQKTQELGDKTYKALSHQLDKWAEEVPELKEIVTENVVSAVKDKVSEELTK